MVDTEPHIIPRSEWCPTPAYWSHPLRTPVPYVMTTFTRKTHCYDYGRCTKELQFLFDKHTKYGDKPDICYSFMIGGDGAVYEGRGWGSQVNLPKRHAHLETRCIVIAMIGHFKHKGPTSIMTEAQRKLIKMGMDHGYIQHKITQFTT